MDEKSNPENQNSELPQRNDLPDIDKSPVNSQVEPIEANASVEPANNPPTPTADSNATDLPPVQSDIPVAETGTDELAAGADPEAVHFIGDSDQAVEATEVIDDSSTVVGHPITVMDPIVIDEETAAAAETPHQINETTTSPATSSPHAASTNAASIGASIPADKQASGAPPVLERKPPLSWQIRPESQLARESIASTGGAVGSVVVGVLAILGTLLTPFSAINAVLGFFLGLWGLTSPRKRLASIGLIICIIGFVLPITVGTINLYDLWQSNQDVNLGADGTPQ